jgi:hypothetical protein
MAPDPVLSRRSHFRNPPFTRQAGVARRRFEGACRSLDLTRCFLSLAPDSSCNGSKFVTDDANRSPHPGARIARRRA